VKGSIRVALVCLLVAVPAGVPAQDAGIYAPPSDLKAPPADAVKNASGLVSRVIMPGTGSERPSPTDVVTVHYTGWSAEAGTLYDSSLERDKPAMFPLDRAALPGWRECVQLMTVGETRRCWLPEPLAYRGVAKRPKGTMVFDIELLDTRPTPLVPPPDVAGPPADAERTASGLFHKVLRPGTGIRNPQRTDQVLVHYSGWTTNGRLFDSSVTRGEPTTLGMDEVIPGWAEGLQLMVAGERRRLWIPQELAYKGQQGAPRGMLVFDVELVQIR
jgi:FKBP-type peptidyl-prolyl cis-trans isomerase